jgi:hypothetical protein
MSGMWSNNMKPKESSKKWRRKAWTIDPKKTRLVFESAEATSESVPPLLHDDLLEQEQKPAWIDIHQLDMEVENVLSCFDNSQPNPELQKSQFSFTYYDV